MITRSLVFACVHAVSHLINILIIGIACVSPAHGAHVVCFLHFIFCFFFPFFPVLFWLRFLEWNIHINMCKQATNRALLRIIIDIILTMYWAYVDLWEWLKQQNMHTRQHAHRKWEWDTFSDLCDRFNWVFMYVRAYPKRPISFYDFISPTSSKCIYVYQFQT